MESGIARAGHPGQHFLFSRLRGPVERLVSPCLQGISNAITGIRCSREILHAALRHGGNDPPTESWNIGTDGCCHRDVVFASQAMCEVEKMGHLVRIGEAGEHVRIKCTQPDATLANIREDFFLLCRRSLLEETLQGPDRFHVPLVPGILRVIPRLADELHRLLQVLPLLSFDIGLQVCVSDIVV